MPRGQRHDVADPDLVAKRRTGRQHLNAANGDPGVVLGYDRERRDHALSLAASWLVAARSLRRRYGVA
jgi:hypothetical protein